MLPKGLKSFRAVKYQRYLDPAAPIKQAKIKRSPDKVTESSNVKTVEKNIVKREPDSDDELLHKKSRGRKQRTSVENKNGFLRRNRK